MDLDAAYLSGLSDTEQKHIARVHAVNMAQTADEHRLREHELRAWRDGVYATGRAPDLCACDMYYIEHGIDRPMCAGVWLDWSPPEGA